LQAGGERIEDVRSAGANHPIGSLEQIVFRMDALHRLERIGVRIVNSASSIEHTVDKYFTSFLLADAGFRHHALCHGRFQCRFAACRENGDVSSSPFSV